MQTLQELARAINAEYVGADTPFTGVSIDSRTLNAGELFVALHGHQDGHAWAEDAVNKGASALLVDHRLPLNVPQIIVPDTLKGLGALASAWRAQFHIPIIALTGSCGKTTTKEMIASILAEVGPTLATEANYNNEIGVPLTLLKLRPEHQFAVVEIGTNSPGEINYATQLVQPTVALITNIQAQHVEKLGSFEGISQEKSDIFAYLNHLGIAIINLDEPFAPSWEAKITTEHRVTFGLTPKANVYAEHITSSVERCEFDLITPLGPQTVAIPSGGQHLVINALAAAATSLSVGASLKHIAAGLARLQAVPGRFRLYRLPTGALLIDDTYNASFKSVENALGTLREFPGTKILVMTHMGELGTYNVKFHQELGEVCHAAQLDDIFFYGQKEVLNYTLKACPQARYFEQKDELIAALLPLLQQQDTLLLVKGSRANKMEEVVERLLTHFKVPKTA